MTKANTAVALLLAMMLIISCDHRYKTLTKTDSKGYQYQMVTNDLYGLRIYTLSNGLKVYLSVNRNEPRIQGCIPVNAGSTYDPADNTGLAHYLEHLMFKGSSRMGTSDWEAEKPLLEEIANLYEQHKADTTAEGRKKIYHKIDSVSQIAAQYAIPNEFDKLMSSIGATDINAYTSLESTVYVSNFPSNELEQWLQIESERLFDMQMRLFHTELEAVYEEFNGEQSDGILKAEELLESIMYPTHPYGQQTVIGKGEHIKSPSMRAIEQFYHKYYVPNNMAICLSGNFDFEQAIELIDKYFGSVPSKAVQRPKFAPEQPLTHCVDTAICNPQSEFVLMGYRLNGVGCSDIKILKLIDYMLYNSQAGLIDLNLIQKQRLLDAMTEIYYNCDYSELIILAHPNQGQTLEEVKQLIEEQVDIIKKGKFPEWMIKACVNDIRLNELNKMSNNFARTIKFVNAFTDGMRWENVIGDPDELEKITRQQICDYANRALNNSITIMKHTGPDTNMVKVDKPEITPISGSAKGMSHFCKQIMESDTSRLKPKFINFDKDIDTLPITDNVRLNYVYNQSAPVFSLNYIIEMGSNNNRLLSLIEEYVSVAGTSRYSADSLQKELFIHGLRFSMTVDADQTTISMSGLEENMERGVELLEHIIGSTRSDTTVYNNMVSQIIQSRTSDKSDPESIHNALYNYAIYGSRSEFTNNIRSDSLLLISVDSLTNLLHRLPGYKHHIFYCGQRDKNAVAAILRKHHYVPAELLTTPCPKTFSEQPISKNKVYFVDYDMVQSLIYIIGRCAPFTDSLIPDVEFFNELYDGNMSSVIFQDIRELRGLAYSASSHIKIPQSRNNWFYNLSYLATQSDKTETAIDELMKLIDSEHETNEQFSISKEALQKQIETEYVINEEIYHKKEQAFRLGINYDVRRNIYNRARSITQADFSRFFNKYISSRPHVLAIVGNKNLIDINMLRKYGEIKELTVDDIFGY